uniref:Uncharacterized protein n=1 Tax=Oryza brachyantha TaxID=4533 RepID=J3LQX0_ORYBR
MDRKRGVEKETKSIRQDRDDEPYTTYSIFTNTISTYIERHVDALLLPLPSITRSLLAAASPARALAGGEPVEQQVDGGLRHGRAGAAAARGRRRRRGPCDGRLGFLFIHLLLGPGGVLLRRLVVNLGADAPTQARRDLAEPGADRARRALQRRRRHDGDATAMRSQAARQ